MLCLLMVPPDEAHTFPSVRVCYPILLSEVHVQSASTDCTVPKADSKYTLHFASLMQTIIPQRMFAVISW